MTRAVRTWLWAAVVVALLAGIIAYALRPRALPVEAGTVTRGPLAAAVEVEAKTRVRNRYTIGATVSGVLGRLPWLEGQRVSAGAVVAVIDPLPSNAAVSQALAQLRELQAQKTGVETLRPKPEAIAQAQSRLASARAAYGAAAERRNSARASYDQARRDAMRAAQLERGGYLARAQLEAARLTETSREKDLALAQSGVASASADIATARAALGEVQAKQSDPDYLKRVYDARIAGINAELRTLQNQAARTTLRAPASGSVLRVLHKSEEFVAAGTPLLEVGNARDLEIVADVLSGDAVRMRPGNPMTIVRGAGDRRLRARVRTVEPAGYTKVSALGIEEQRVNVIGEFVDPPGNLGDQYRLDVQITTWSAQRALRVPIAALFRCGEAWCAFSIQNGRARRVTVRTGHTGEAGAEVLSGLTPGERVILHPSDRLEDGSAVRV